jgi:hypothetical protein
VLQIIHPKLKLSYCVLGVANVEHFAQWQARRRLSVRLTTLDQPWDTFQQPCDARAPCFVAAFPLQDNRAQCESGGVRYARAEGEPNTCKRDADVSESSSKILHMLLKWFCASCACSALSCSLSTSSCISWLSQLSMTATSKTLALYSIIFSMPAKSASDRWPLFRIPYLRLVKNTFEAPALNQYVALSFQRLRPLALEPAGLSP